MSKLYSNIFFFFTFISLWSTISADAKPASNSGLGTDFIVGVIANSTCSTCNLTIFINTKVPNNATISSNITGDIEIPMFEGVATVVLPPTLIPDFNPGHWTGDPQSYAVRVRTRELASVQATVNSTKDEWSAEGTVIFPVESLGTTYFINTVQDCPDILVASPFNWTTLSVYNLNQHVVVRTTLQALQAIAFGGEGFDGVIIQTSSPVAVFFGSTCGEILWEQVASASNFGRDFVLVNPAAGQSKDTISATLRIVNGDNKDVVVDISGLTEISSIDLEFPGQVASIQTTNLTNRIHSTGLIDVQVISESPCSGNRAELGLIPNNQFVNEALFFVDPLSDCSLLSLVALTSDIRNSRSILTFNEVSFDLKLFQVSADPDYSYAIFTPEKGSNYMNASFKLGGYLSEDPCNSVVKNATRFGSVIGRNLK